MKNLYVGLIATVTVLSVGVTVSILNAQTTYLGVWTETNGLTQALGDYVCQTGPQFNPFGPSPGSLELFIECCDSPQQCWEIDPVDDELYVYDDGNPTDCPGWNCPGGATQYRLTKP